MVQENARHYYPAGNARNFALTLSGVEKCALSLTLWGMKQGKIIESTCLREHVFFAAIESDGCESEIKLLPVGFSRSEAGTDVVAYWVASRIRFLGSLGRRRTHLWQLRVPTHAHTLTRTGEEGSDPGAPSER